MQYALVTDNGFELHYDIPESFKNVSGFQHLSEVERKAFRFYTIYDRIVTNGITTFNSMFHSYAELLTYDSTDDAVYRVITYTLLSKSEIVANMLRASGERRYTVEVGGMTLPNGVTIETNRESQAMITQAVASMRNGYLSYVDFKASNGWIQLDLPNLDYIGSETAKHVQRCFTVEKNKTNEILALTTVEELMAYDLDADWFGKAFLRIYKNLTI